MEKFGIFSLLSALAGQTEEKPREEADAKPSAAQPSAKNLSSAEEQSGARAARAERFLENHDAISRRIDKNNRR